MKLHAVHDILLALTLKNVEAPKKKPQTRLQCAKILINGNIYSNLFIFIITTYKTKQDKTRHNNQIELVIWICKCVFQFELLITKYTLDII